MFPKKSSSFIDMKKIVILGLIFLFSVPFANSSSKTYKVVCYLSSWANYRSEGKFVIEDIDPTLCTHLVYAFASLTDNQITAYDTNLDLKENYGLGAYDRFNNLREKRPGLKTLIAIGGWNEGSKQFSPMASDQDSRKKFVDSCVEFLLKHKFNGLDLQWMHPTQRDGGKPEDKENFALLIKELREAFRTHDFLLTAALSPQQYIIDSAYNVSTLAEELDFISLLAYDFHGGWEKITGHHAPLNYSATEPEANQKLNVDSAVKYWLSKDVPPEKLILGMPLFGRSFKLQDPKKHGLGAPATGAGTSGNGMNEGMMGYNEICDKVKPDGEWEVVFDREIQAPYAVKDNQWIGYDDPKSIAIKVSYLKEMGLGGGMVWSLDTDDFRGNCNGQTYPLLRAVNAGLNIETALSPDKPEQGISVTPENGQETSTDSDISTTIGTTAVPKSASEGNAVSFSLIITLTNLVFVFMFHLYTPGILKQ